MSTFPDLETHETFLARLLDEEREERTTERAALDDRITELNRQIGALTWERDSARACCQETESALAAIRQKFGWEFDHHHDLGEWALDDLTSAMQQQKLGQSTIDDLVESLQTLNEVDITCDGDWVPRTLNITLERNGRELPITLTLKSDCFTYEIEVDP